MAPEPQHSLAWKDNWNQSRQRLESWWGGQGLVVGSWFPPLANDPRAGVAAPWPQHPPDRLERARNGRYRAELSRAILARQWFGLDCLPVADTSLGPGSLATMLGSEPELSDQATWFHPCWQNLDEPERLPPLVLDSAHPWYRTQDEILRETRALAGDDYAPGMPDFAEGLDTLASLRDVNRLMEDMLERPGWVHQKLAEIQRIRLGVFDRFYQYCRTRESWTFHTSFRFGGPGKTDKIQCDAAAMISPAMFREFCLPHIRAHCRHMDHAMFHLDGSECLDKLDDLLAVEELDAIEWSPDPKSGGSEHPRWHELYRRIRNAGKAVQVINLEVAQVAPLLDAVGPNAMFLLVGFNNLQQADELERIVAGYR